MKSLKLTRKHFLEYSSLALYLGFVPTFFDCLIFELTALPFKQGLSSLNYMFKDSLSTRIKDVPYGLFNFVMTCICLVFYPIIIPIRAIIGLYLCRSASYKLKVKERFADYTEQDIKRMMSSQGWDNEQHN